MRKLWMATAILVAGTACSTSGAVEGSGAAGQRNYTVGGFDRIGAAGPHDVRVTVGSAPSVRAEGDEAELERLEVSVRDGQLRIGTKPGSWTSKGRVTVHVTAPSLQAAEVSGSGTMEVSPLRAAQFRGAVSGSGDLVLQGLESDAATFGIAGSGSLRAAGRARSVSLNVAGSGSGQLENLQAQDADITVAGSGGAEIRASGTAAVAIAGSGNVAVTGGARCTLNKAGSGGLRCS